MNLSAKSKIGGFTLIELLVVISVIAILSVIGMAVYTNVQTKAVDAKLKADFDSMYKNLEQARILQQKTFYGLTGTGCTECACRGKNVTTDTTCIDTVTNNWSKVTSAPIPKDPWGGIYMFDENEAEPGQAPCRKDVLYSAGPDNIRQASDDKSWAIPFLNC